MPDEHISDVILVIHGGAGVLSHEMHTPESEWQYRDTLRQSLEAGKAALEKADGGSLDAIVAAIQVMEDSTSFNAGKGASFNHDGVNELDAAIMDGSDRRAGAVAGLTIVKNPIAAARAVMDHSPHVMLAGAGAEAFAREQRLEIVDPSYFRTELRWQMLQEFLRNEQARKQESGRDAPKIRFGTVGCVALDRQGNLAAGTSTGGMTGKLPGRIGDSPLIGAGTFADDASCAVSGTGDGEYFIRAVAAHDTAAMVEYKGLSVAEAAHNVIYDKIKPAGGEGGVIVLDRAGHAAMVYCTEGMYRGYLTRGGEIRVMIFDR
jgi:beta-aspartyl-peptidase (threonine type)